MNLKNYRYLFTCILVLGLSACLPFAVTLPDTIDLPSITMLERKFDLPFIHLGSSERSTSFKQSCSSSQAREIQESGIALVESRSIGAFSSIKLTGIGSIEIKQGERAQVSVRADTNLMPFLETELKGDQLVLGIADGICFSHSEIGVTYLITVKDLDLLHISGAGDVQLDQVNLERLRIQLDGSAHIVTTDLQLDILETEFNGTGVIELAGQVNSHIVDLNGVGQYLAGDLLSQSTRIKLNGTGSIEVWALEDLYIELNGIGAVSYFGQPEVSTANSGWAGITHLGPK
jgi:hypothetical protein